MTGERLEAAPSCLRVERDTRRRCRANAAAIAIVLLVVTCAPAGTLAQQAAVISLSDGRLSVRVREVPLGDVLQLIVARSGIGIAASGNLEARVTANFQGVEPDEAIRRLAGRHASVWIAVPAHLVGRPATGQVIGTLPRSLPPSRPQLEMDRLDAASRALRDADPRVRVRGVLALGRLRTPEAAAALQTALADPAVPVRLQAVYALRRSQDPAAVPALSQVSASDSEPQVRLAAVRALARLRGAGVVAALEWASRDTDASIRHEAQRALARIAARP